MLWDPTSARSALRFGNAERRTERWVALADDVFLGVDDEQSLREIGFANVQLVTDESSWPGRRRVSSM